MHNFFLDNGEDFRRKKPEFKGKENEIECTTKICLLKKCFFFILPKNIVNCGVDYSVLHACLGKCSFVCKYHCILHDI